jgi:hypothetical protein
MRGISAMSHFIPVPPGPEPLVSPPPLPEFRCTAGAVAAAGGPPPAIADPKSRLLGFPALPGPAPRCRCLGPLPRCPPPVASAAVSVAVAAAVAAAAVAGARSGAPPVQLPRPPPCPPPSFPLPPLRPRLPVSVRSPTCAVAGIPGIAVACAAAPARAVRAVATVTARVRHRHFVAVVAAAGCRSPVRSSRCRRRHSWDSQRCSDGASRR